MNATEYRVRPVTRYVLTRHVSNDDGAGATYPLGEFDHERYANEVAEMLKATSKLVKRVVAERDARQALVDASVAINAEKGFPDVLRMVIYGKARDRGMDRETAVSLTNALMSALFLVEDAPSEIVLPPGHPWSDPAAA